MIESLSGSDLLNELAHEFAERYRRGERPPVNEYTDRYPDLAGEIRDLFPTLVLMEQFGSGVENRSGPVARRPRVDEPMPERLGDYRILREIGRGGMGIVYEAVQESLGRQVALKVLTQHRQLGAIQLLRFEREAKAAALLHHTNIVPVFGVGEHQGVHYYAMQYIEGQSLDVVLAEIHRLRARSCAVADVSRRAEPVANRRASQRACCLTACWHCGRRRSCDLPGNRRHLRLLSHRRRHFPRRKGVRRSRTSRRRRRQSWAHPRRTIFAAWRGWACRRPRLWVTRICTGFSTEISSRPTCSWTYGELSGSRILAWPRPRDRRN